MIKKIKNSDIDCPLNLRIAGMIKQVKDGIDLFNQTSGLYKAKYPEEISFNLTGDKGERVDFKINLLTFKV